jgi:hypothetical protein
MSFHDRYFEALGVNENDKCGRVETALKLAHDIRQFEIELYWKRATYFWAFQLIAFTTLGFLFKDGQVTSLGRLLIPAPLGVITAFAGLLTACGSKFWQENWEAHVDLLENKTGVRLTEVIVCPKPPKFSVSRVNGLLLLLLTIGWGMVLLIGAFPRLAELLRDVPAPFRGIGVLIAVVSACAWMWSKRTNLPGRVYRLGDQGWTRYSSKRKGTVPFIIWRDPPGSSPDGGK